MSQLPLFKVIPAINGLSTVLSDIPEIVSEVSTSMSSRAARIYEDTNLQVDICLLDSASMLENK